MRMSAERRAPLFVAGDPLVQALELRIAYVLGDRARPRGRLPKEPPVT
jgi:hypothetical protein